MRAPVAGLLLVAFAFMSPPPACAGDSAPPTPAPHPLVAWHPRPWQPAPALRAGLRAAIDPVTGEWTEPAAADLRAAAAARAARPRAADVALIMRADGSRAARVGDRFRSFSVVSIGADGRLHADCAHSESAALERARADAAKVAAPEER